mgnify:CR=1 FL=1
MREKQIIESIKENKDIIYDKNFFDYIKGTSLLELRKNINLVQDLNPTLYLEEKVDWYYDELLKQYNNKTGLFLEYQKLLNFVKNKDYASLDQYKKYNYFVQRETIIKLEDCIHNQNGLETAYRYLLKNTDEKISEIIVDGLFKDSIYNVWINIKEMLRYLNHLEDKETVLHREKRQFYQKILDIDSLTNEDKIKLYYELKDKNIALSFYQDWYKVRKYSYQRIKNVLFKVKEKSNLFCYQKSLLEKVPIYELDGQDFFMLVNCRSEYTTVDVVRRYCYSLISPYNIEVFNNKKFIYGYSDFSLDEIMHVFEDDIASSGNFKSNSFTTRFVNRIMTPEEISYSKGYSEIQMVNKRMNSDLTTFYTRRPNYLVVFDHIDKRHLIEAKRLNIPIVIIPTSKYLQKAKGREKKCEELDIPEFKIIFDTYTNGSETEKEKRARR